MSDITAGMETAIGCILIIGLFIVGAIALGCFALGAWLW